MTNRKNEKHLSKKYAKRFEHLKAIMGTIKTHNDINGGRYKWIIKKKKK